MTTHAQPSAGSQVLNVPNVLTALRLLLAIVVFVLIPLERFIAAMVVFIIAAGTDWVDGYWARKYGQVTQLGRIFDPFVDKIIICGAFIFLSSQPGSGVPAWMSVVVVGRELLVTALRSFLEQRGADFSAEFAGKLKFVFQCAAVVASLLALWWAAEHDRQLVTNWYGSARGSGQAVAGGLPQWLNLALLVSIWLAVLSTVQSGVGYIFKAARLLRQ
jgi:CDP-diacylglycerol--glycerol-3-phosphate 3-phosphatidyltransferase